MALFQVSLIFTLLLTGNQQKALQIKLLTNHSCLNFGNFFLFYFKSFSKFFLVPYTSPNPLSNSQYSIQYIILLISHTTIPSIINTHYTTFNSRCALPAFLEILCVYNATPLPETTYIISKGKATHTKKNYK